jgi:transposase
VQECSQIAAWSDTIDTLRRAGVSPRAIYDRLRLQELTFKGTYPQVKRLCRALRRAQGPRAEEVVIPVETLPGAVAQVDFGYVGKMFDPVTHVVRDAWVFVMVLGFSRLLVTRVVFDQKIETWLRLHVEAFEELGGVPETVVPDNLKAAVIRAAFSVSGSPSELNRSYRELARHCGFKIDPTPPYAPGKKGKVEAGVKYVKHNFFEGRPTEDIALVRPQLAQWTATIANQRRHGTTQQIPAEVFSQAERAKLLPLPAKPFEMVFWREAKVHTDSHIAVEQRLYSVPWRFIGRSVWVRLTATTIAVFADDERIATHARHEARGHRSTVDAHLPEHRVDLRHRSRSHWEERAAKMGDDVLLYVRDVFEADDVLLQLRTVQAIVLHLESFPVDRAQAACRRARHYACYTYSAIKRILRGALDLEPSPAPQPELRGVLSSPRYARAIRDLYPGQEIHHESN